MARPLRYKAAGATYHVMARGEGSGMYFRIVADYNHLNPVRSGRRIGREL